MIALLQVSWRPAVSNRKEKPGHPACPRGGQTASAAAHTAATNALAGGIHVAACFWPVKDATEDMEGGGNGAAIGGTGDPNP